MKLVSRAAWGARAYKTPGGAIRYGRARRGVKFHYLGVAYSDRAHGQCAAYIRQLQNSHMNTNGWSDIGYSFLVCTHGYVYEGRGLKRRNSANGNTSLNEQDYAICLLVGSSGLTKPTIDQLHGARDALEYVRKQGPAGSWIGGHRDGYATACPGSAIYDWVKKGAPRPTGKPPEEGLDMNEKQVFDAVWKQDIAAAPSSSSTRDKNPTWQPINMMRELYDRVRELQAAVDELSKKVK